MCGVLGVRKCGGDNACHQLHALHEYVLDPSIGKASSREVGARAHMWGRCENEPQTSWSVRFIQYPRPPSHTSPKLPTGVQSERRLPGHPPQAVLPPQPLHLGCNRQPHPHAWLPDDRNRQGVDISVNWGALLHASVLLAKGAAGLVPRLVPGLVPGLVGGKG